MKFRKKPVEVEAVEVSKLIKSEIGDWPFWIKREYQEGKISVLMNGIKIATLEGIMYADKDDWIIKGVAGEIYPCKPDIFNLTYEPITSPTNRA